MDDDAVPVLMTATCRTAGCDIEGQPIQALLFAAPAPPIYRAICAQCGKAVTDLVPITG